VAWLHTNGDGVQTVWISSPPGASPRRYEPAPFATKDIYNAPTLKFSPDGKQILLILNGGAGEQSWLMPYPPDAANPPRRVLPALPAARGTPRFSWMPDNRHLVVSTTPGAQPYQLYMADTVSGSWTMFSGGTTAQTSPAVSPDGSRLVFLESTTDHDIVSVNLSTAAVSPLITTQRSEEMPAWAAREAALVYVTNRNGRPEIWLHKPGQPDRPLVTARDFPTIATSFMSPVLSPDATRVIYGGLNPDSTVRLWMSAVAGGAPVPLLKGAEDYLGSWSPDGNWFVYWHSADGRTSVRKVKTTGQAEPEVLRADVKQTEAWLPVWSPSGEWILYEDAGVKLMTPDGKTTRELSSKTALTYAFSTDGQTIYGLRGSATTTVELFSMNVSGRAEKTIAMLGPEHLPSNSLGPALRLTLTPDGTSVTYSTRTSTANLWLIEGLNTVIP
jgi:Tol biopolymer transport system component